MADNIFKLEIEPNLSCGVWFSLQMSILNSSFMAAILLFMVKTGIQDGQQNFQVRDWPKCSGACFSGKCLCETAESWQPFWDSW